MDDEILNDRDVVECPGCTANIIERSGLDKDIHFIQKPSSLGGLAEKILEAFNEDKKGAGEHLSP